MPHQRKRHLLNEYSTTIKHSPIVGIFGHRQVGKTTFLEANAKHYYTFDDSETFDQAANSAKDFLKALDKPLTAIDECQLVPSLFPALKEKVRLNKAPGQIILSGSVRFYSREAIKESLTGRIGLLELLPMTVTEIGNMPLSTIILKIFDRDQVDTLFPQFVLNKKAFNERSDLILKYLDRGGLPGLCFIRDPLKRNNQLKFQLKTILGRDIKLVYNTTLSYQQILEFIQVLAKHEGHFFTDTDIKNETGISPVTQKKLLNALEAIFLIRQVKIEGDRKGYVIFLEDQAESKYLAGNENEMPNPYIGLIYRNLRETFFYKSGHEAEFFIYISRSGAKIDLALRQGNKVIGIIYCETDTLSRSQLGSAYSFLKRYAHSKIIVVTHYNTILKKINDRIFQIPLEYLLFE